ncbi:GntR family transcriptional regulator [Brucella intermedia]|uniref:GntR family transcriptional regulator n=1 Tax=Brucella intermedia TaxID=94625 RepID=UPI00178C4D59|nr:GntR family transcriptional regulator [Brucella intermedia]
MPERYISEILHQFPGIAHHTAPLTGIEATMYNRLWRSIIDGKLRPGAKLREGAICETFGVSRTLVRKVLLIMEHEGIVHLPPNHGAYVATPSSEEARDVCEAAKLIGIYTASGLADPAQEVSKENVRRIEKMIALQEKAEEEGDFTQARRISGEFQILLAHVYGNKILAAQFENLITRLAMSMTLYQAGRLQPPRAQWQTELLAKILNHDKEQVVALMRNFYHSIENSLQFSIGSEEPNLKAILIETASLPPRPSGQGKRQKGKASGT